MTITKESPIPPDLLAIKGPELNFFASTYPDDLRKRYTATALKFRAKLHEWTKQLLLDRKQHEPSASESIGAALLSKNLLLPQRITDLNSPFDCIASVLALERNSQIESVLIMENPTYGRSDDTFGYNEGGIGKTALSLAILNIPQFLDKLPLFQSDRLIEMQEFPLLPLSPKPDTKLNIKVVSLDLTYLGLHKGQLVTTPIVGVAGFDGQSDIARSVTRAKTKLAGIPYDRRRTDISRYYTSCARRIFLQSDIFVSTESIIPLTKIIALNFIKSPEQSEYQQRKFLDKRKGEIIFFRTDFNGWVALDVLEETTDIFYSLFRINPLFHPSPTWRVNPNHQLLTVDVIKPKLPKNIAFLNIYPGKDGYTPENAQPTFQISAEFVKEWIT